MKIVLSKLVRMWARPTKIAGLVFSSRRWQRSQSPIRLAKTALIPFDAMAQANAQSIQTMPAAMAFKTAFVRSATLSLENIFDT